MASSLSPVPLLDLVSNLQIQAAQAKKNVLSLKNHSVKVNQPKFIATCGDEYAHAMTQLTDARKSLSHGKIGDAKKYFVLKAMGSVNSCDVEYAEVKRDKSTIGKDSKKFKDLCSVVLVMCDKLLHHVHVELL